MRHKTILFEQEALDFFAYSLYRGGATNRAQIERMKKILIRAISSELTARQRDCLMLYYIKNMKMREIARTLSLSPSTVTRHIKAAKEKLRRIAQYYE